jgi:cyclase
MELAQVGADVYACLQPDTGLGASNSGFVNVDGGLVVDTMWDLPRTRHMIDLYATVASSPARRLVNTHHNGDHCWGNQLFADTGTEILGHRLCVEWFTKEASPELFVALCEADDVAPPLDGFARALRAFDFHDIVLTPPTTLLDGDTVLDLDGLEVQLLYVGPAHTPGDVVVHLPSEGIVFTGDILFHRCTPIGWEGTFDNWIAALERIEALEPATVVPGHGPLADVDGLRGLREYLEYVRAEARAGYEAGLTTLETARRIDLGPYRLWTEPERLAFQVDRAYRELSGVAWDQPVDTGRVFAEVAALREAYESAELG